MKPSFARRKRFRGLFARSLTRFDLRQPVPNEEPVIRSPWNELSARQQDVLRVVALGAEKLFSSEVRDRYGLPAASSVHKAVEALLARGLLVRDADGIRFDSPFFRRWVRRGVAPDVG